jgi:hypothetical protein
MGIVLFAGAIVVSAPLMRSERQLSLDSESNRNLIGLQQLSPVEVRED